MGRDSMSPAAHNHTVQPTKKTDPCGRSGLLPILSASLSAWRLENRFLGKQAFSTEPTSLRRSPTCSSGCGPNRFNGRPSSSHGFLKESMISSQTGVLERSFSSSIQRGGDTKVERWNNEKCICSICSILSDTLCPLILK